MSCSRFLVPATAALLVMFLARDVRAASPAGAAVVGDGEGRLLTSLVATAAAKDPMFDVLTRDDVRNALAVEAEKQSLGCAESSCLAEIAGAMGARIVVYGSVGRLGQQLVLTLNLFDSEAARSGGRRVAQAVDLDKLAALVEPTTQELLQAFVQRGGLPQSTRVRLIVLDLEVQATPVAEPVVPPGPSPLLIGGIGAGVLGLVGVGVGAFFDSSAVAAHAEANDKTTTQRDAAALAAKSDGDATVALVSYLAGGTLAAVGVVAAAAGMFLE